MKTLDEVIKALDGWMLDCDNCPLYCRRDENCTISDALHYLKEYRLTIDDIAAKRKALEYKAELHQQEIERIRKQGQEWEDRCQAEIARYQEAVRNCEEAENKYRKAEQDALKALDDWASRPAEENKKLVLTVDNPPLTWSELKTMVGKPVWVEGSVFADGFWTIIQCFGESGVAEYVFFEGDQYWKENMGDAEDGLSWQAYRKERGA